MGILKNILLKLFRSKISGARYLELNDILRPGDIILYKSVFSFSPDIVSHKAVVISSEPLLISTDCHGRLSLFDLCRISKDIFVVRSNLGFIKSEPISLYESALKIGMHIL